MNDTERTSLLQGARERFIEASVAAPKPIAAAIADWHVGVTWLLASEPQAAETVWAQARDAAFLALTQARNAQWNVHEESKKVLNPLRRALLNSPPGREKLEQLAAEQVWEEQIVPRGKYAMEIACLIQRSRGALGVAKARCAIPELKPWPPPKFRLYLGNFEIVVNLGEHPTDVCGWTIQIHDVAELTEVERADFPRPIWIANVDLSLRCPHGRNTVFINLDGSQPWLLSRRLYSPMGDMDSFPVGGHDVVHALHLSGQGEWRDRVWVAGITADAVAVRVFPERTTTIDRNLSLHSRYQGVVGVGSPIKTHSKL